MTPEARPRTSTAPPTPDATGTLLEALRRRVLLRGALRAVAACTLAALGVAVVLVTIDLLAPLPAGARRTLRWLPLLALAPIPIAFLATRARATMGRLALLADERGGRGNVTSTLRGANAEGLVAEAFRRRASAEMRRIDPRLVVPLDAARLWSACVAAGLVLVPTFTLLDGPRSPDARWLHLVDNPSRAAGMTSGGAGSAEVVPLPSLGDVTFTLRPPRYTDLPAIEGRGGDPLSALPGSVIEVRGSGDPRGGTLRAAVVGGASLPTDASEPGWSLSWIVRPDDRGLSLTMEQEGTLLERRVLPLRPLRDRAPVVTLEQPERDLVLATPRGVVPVFGRAEDDFGITDIELHWVRSRGSGESFDFEEGTWSWDEVVAVPAGLTGSRSLDLAELGLEPGDVLHVRTVARDANDVTGPGVGVSQTRQIRISREDDLSDVTTIIGFPIEREREPLLSQRMIILLTEELIAERAALDSEQLQDRSADIADEQARLRARIGEQIFSRATGAMQDPEAHLDFEEGESEVFLDELEAAAAEGPVIDPETGIASIANVDIPAHDHDSDPIVAINRSLLTVYNYMWDAERMLRGELLDPSLMPQNLALDELQRVRDSERIFVRGRVAVRPIDVPAARGTGEIDDAAPVGRTSTLSTRDAQRIVAEIERLLAGSAPPTGRLASIEISGLALDVLGDGDASETAAAEASTFLSAAAEHARGGDVVGVESGLREALRILRAADVRTVPSAAQAPTSAAAARYLASNPADEAPAVDAETDGADPIPFVFATVRYESGDWDSAPLVPTNLIHALAQYTEVPVAPEGVVVDLSSPEIFDHPFLYITGHLPVFFGDAEGRNLVDFVERGGLVFIDDHNHDIDGAFNRSITTELGRLFGSDALVPLENDHELYSSFFVFDDGPPITGHELSGWGDGLIHRELQHVEVGGRIGVLYSNKDYSSEWSYHAENKRFLAVDNTRFGVNILVYALTR